MKTSIFLCLFLLLFLGKTNAQAVGIGTATPNSSALLDITSTSKGMLVPRVNLTSLADGATIASPATSLLVYNTNAALAGGTGYYYNSGTPAAPAWVKMLTNTSAGWSLTGNAGIDPATNFIGTTDNKPLKFRVSNVPSGSIDHNTRSTFFGAEAGQNHPFVGNVSSTGVGYQVMSVNAGFSNAAVGALSMANNGQFGSRNSALGYESLYSNVDGQRNVAIGHTALRANTGGDENVAVGDSAMASNTTGINNIAIGANALKRNLVSGGNVAVGYYALENTTNNSNVAVGNYSMRANTTGGSNTAVGWASLNSNLNGDRNVAIGHYAMEDNISGIYNAALGYGSLRLNTSGEHNTALGYIALNSNHSGDFNTAVGSFALASNDNGSNNTVVGYDALGNANYTSNNIAIGKSALNRMTFTNGGSLWSGDNIAIGVEALFSTNPSAASNLIPTNGVSNVGVGNYALRANTTGEANVAIGHQSLYNNTTGFWNNAIGQQSLYFNTIGNSNVSIGNNSMRNNIDGEDNVSIGIAAMNNNTSGSNNTAVGMGALNANTTGINNTAVGSGAGSFNNANTYCTFLGYEADQDAGTNYASSMALGYNSRITASSQVRIGSTTTASIGGYQPWSNLSDGRFKKNISDQVKGLDFIMALRPVTYNIDVNQLASYLNEDRYKDKTGNILAKPVNARVKQERNEESLVLHTGFVAQEVEAAAKKLNYDFSGVDKPKNASDLYALRYSEFVVPLVKGMQEQQQEITALKERIQKLEELLKTAMAGK